MDVFKPVMKGLELVEMGKATMWDVIWMILALTVLLLGIAQIVRFIRHDNHV